MTSTNITFKVTANGTFFSTCGRYIIEQAESGHWTAYTSKGNEQDADSYGVAERLCQQHLDGDHLLFNA